MKVQVFNTTGRRVPRGRILRLVREVLTRYGPSGEAEIRVIFVDDETIQSLNRQFLHRDEPTDVISFDLSEDERRREGEVYVSVPTAERQSRDYRTTLWEELARLATHGALHLVGFDDATEEDRQRMHSVEDELLKTIRSTR